ncbi:MAG: hypothetical protein NTU41_00375 [Chloroflexi bacterium]|nr:hypothetical protein [Chloroflexota bacterium]
MRLRKRPRCSMCGRCCREQGSGFVMMPADYRRWRRGCRADILRYLWLLDGRRANGSLWIDWADPDTGHYLSCCPFLERAGWGKCVCRIHETKPRICREFWCEWAYGVGRKGAPFRGMGGWSQRARQFGYGQHGVKPDRRVVAPSDDAATSPETPCLLQSTDRTTD